MEEILDHYLELITDPAHTLVETTFIAAELIIGSVLWAKVLKPRWQRMLDYWHRRIDTEHGYKHDRDDYDSLTDVPDREIINALLHRQNNPRVNALLDEWIESRQRD